MSCLNLKSTGICILLKMAVGIGLINLVLVC